MARNEKVRVTYAGFALKDPTQAGTDRRLDRKEGRDAPCAGPQESTLGEDIPGARGDRRARVKGDDHLEVRLSTRPLCILDEDGNADSTMEPDLAPEVLVWLHEMVRWIGDPNLLFLET